MNAARVSELIQERQKKLSIKVKGDDCSILRKKDGFAAEARSIEKPSGKRTIGKPKMR